jgi:hypothetical protein
MFLNLHIWIFSEFEKASWSSSSKWRTPESFLAWGFFRFAFHGTARSQPRGSLRLSRLGRAERRARAGFVAAAGPSVDSGQRQPWRRYYCSCSLPARRQTTRRLLEALACCSIMYCRENKYSTPLRWYCYSATQRADSSSLLMSNDDLRVASCNHVFLLWIGAEGTRNFH